MDFHHKAKTLLNEIFGEAVGAKAFTRLLDVVDRYPIHAGVRSAPLFSHDDLVLITYADSLVHRNNRPLKIFGAFADAYLRKAFSHIHFLPFFPFSSDDGFSVKDFYAVRQDLGDWEDIASVGRRFNLMFDFVLNHISSESDWFKKYLSGEADFHDLAIEVPPGTDLSSVVRPRTLPLLSTFTKGNGDPVKIWTTFSSDQVDLNYRSIDTLARMIDVLLFYVSKGATIIRMDAVAYLWKQIGTPCIHLRQTHLIVKLLRVILDRVAPRTVIITETNVPHLENISYFGDGTDEAQMVYNFTLPPLLLHTFIIGDATDLSSWAATLGAPNAQCTFFNFTASHDGIGVRPLEGILPREAVDRLVARVLENNGRVSARSNTDGTESPYELNISYIDALQSADDTGDAMLVRRFLAAQAIGLVLPGVPAIYIHSILGSRNWEAGVAMTGRNRSINRERLDVGRVTRDLEDAGSFRARIFYPYRRMIQLRRLLPALHPNAESLILDVDPRVFAIRRRIRDTEMTALTNVTGRPLSVSRLYKSRRPTDLISGRTIDTAKMNLDPYQTIWLVPEGSGNTG